MAFEAGSSTLLTPDSEASAALFRRNAPQVLSQDDWLYSIASPVLTSPCTLISENVPAGASSADQSCGNMVYPEAEHAANGRYLSYTAAANLRHAVSLPHRGSFPFPALSNPNYSSAVGTPIVQVLGYEGPRVPGPDQDAAGGYAIQEDNSLAAPRPTYPEGYIKEGEVLVSVQRSMAVMNLEETPVACAGVPAFDVQRLAADLRAAWSRPPGSSPPRAFAQLGAWLEATTDERSQSSVHPLQPGCSVSQLSAPANPSRERTPPLEYMDNNPMSAISVSGYGQTYPDNSYVDVDSGLGCFDNPLLSSCVPARVYPDVVRTGSPTEAIPVAFPEAASVGEELEFFAYHQRSHTIASNILVPQYTDQQHQWPGNGSRALSLDLMGATGDVDQGARGSSSTVRSISPWGGISNFQPSDNVTQNSSTALSPDLSARPAVIQVSGKPAVSPTSTVTARRKLAAVESKASVGKKALRRSPRLRDRYLAVPVITTPASQTIHAVLRRYIRIASISPQYLIADALFQESAASSSAAE
ncbi:hypothetical protein LXA43DRAFT_1104465 [Ganoderma leucocontextum]|nr:hypothetical protein LXA43DRAFT_1104465 [Ganoderma leucocontextum]